MTNMKTLRKIVDALVGPLAIVGLLVVLGASLANTPVVYQSWSSKKCVSVTSWGGIYSCKNLPRKYIHRWTK